MNQPSELELAACVGLDWADQQHLICLQATGSARNRIAAIGSKARRLA